MLQLQDCKEQNQMQLQSTAYSYLAENNGTVINTVAKEDDSQQNVHINSK